MSVDESLVGEKAPEDIKDPVSGEVIVKKGRKITKIALKRMSDLKIRRVQIESDYVSGKILATMCSTPKRERYCTGATRS